jgi:hypothetical protein
MARTSKVALLVAAALAVVAIFVGTAAASPATSAPAQQPYIATAFTPTAAATGDSTRAAVAQLADRGRGGPAGWRDGPLDRRSVLPLEHGYWSLGEILQWVAIAMLAGAALALVVWRPWRRGPAVAAVTPSNPRQPTGTGQTQTVSAAGASSHESQQAPPDERETQT